MNTAFIVPNFIAIGALTHPRNLVRAHDHAFWEILLFTRGEGVARFAERTVPFRPGTIFCIPPGARHSETSPQGYQNIWIAVDEFQSAGELTVIQETVEHPVYSIAAILLIESQLRRPAAEMIVRNMFDTFMIYLNEWQATDSRDRLLTNLQRKLISNIQNPDFRIAQALEEIPMSRDHTRRLFTERTGRSPMQYLIDLRVDRAKELLQMGLGIKEVACKVGLPDPYYFSRLFKKRHGRSPTEFRAGLHGTLARGEKGLVLGKLEKGVLE